MQNILVIVILVAAISYLGFIAYKSFTKKKDCSDGNCGCD